MLRSGLMGAALAAICCVGFAADRLSAADEPAGAPAPDRGHGLLLEGSRLALLRLDVVAKDLDLTDAQIESLKKIADDARKQMRELRDSLKDTPRDQRQTKLRDAHQEIDKKIDSVLNDKQRARLLEIRLQVRGAAALREKEVADALKLSDDQLKKLSELAEARRTAVRAINGAVNRSARDKITEIVKATTAKMQEVLTPEQRDQFEKMKGKKLDLGAAAFGSLGGPGRRPPGSGSK